MDSDVPSFGARLLLALGSFFSILTDPAFAARVARARAGLPPPSAPPPPSAEPPRPSLVAETRVSAVDERAALQLLALLQREGRFVDFLEEDVAGFADAQIGAAARIVHEGCRKALREHLPVGPVRTEAEGARVTVEPGYDARALRLVGQVGAPLPREGTLVHRGYRVTEVKLPKLHDAFDASVVAPAEIEL